MNIDKVLYAVKLYIVPSEYILSNSYTKRKVKNILKYYLPGKMTCEGSHCFSPSKISAMTEMKYNCAVTKLFLEHELW